MLALVIFLLFGALFFIAVIATGLKEIKENWPKYKCNPSIMPFAGQFGHNTMQNFTECIGGIQMNLMGFFLGPLYSIIKNISSLGTKLLSSIQSIREMLSWMRFSVFELVKDILAMFVNIVSRFQLLIIKIKSLIMRMLSVGLVLLYKMQAGVATMESAYDGPPGDIMRFLATFPG